MKTMANKGITLIALIITILVLLILTGVSIATLTGENGIINKATGAKAEMTIAEEKEAISLAYAAAVMETLGQDVTADDLKSQLIVNGYDASKVTVTEEGENTKVVFAKSGNSYKVSPKGVITGPTTGSNPGVTPPVEEPENPGEDIVATIPYYPQGFEKVEGTNLETGLVMTDGTNYWTWVEVPRTKEIYDTATLSLTPDSDGLYTETECTTIEEDLIAYTETLLSGRGANTSRMGWKDEWYEGCGIASEEEYNALKRKMLSSVYTNGGFWIGQYEMGASTYTFTRDNAARTPVIQKGAYVYNNVTISEAQTLASNINSGNKTSSLLFGLQWDLVLKHFQNKGVSESLLTSDSSTWGNYKNSEFTIDNGKYAYCEDINVWTGYKDYTESVENIEYYSFPDGIKPKDKSLLLTTGASKTNCEMNIYDLAGNVDEWTLEHATTNTYNPCAHRGGFYLCFGSDFPASYRNDYSTTYENLNRVGFRPALY